MLTGIIHTLDLERDGKGLSYLDMPFSVDRSPYYHVRVPIGVACNRAGPRSC